MSPETKTLDEESRAILRRIVESVAWRQVASINVLGHGLKFTTELDAKLRVVGELDRALELFQGVRGNLLELPFPDAAFDIVVCSWALETVSEPVRAAAELKRVLAPGGLLCSCFCTRPESRIARLRSALVRSTVTRLFKGRFLHRETRSAFGAGRIRWISCHGGLSTFVSCRNP